MGGLPVLSSQERTGSLQRDPPNQLRPVERGHMGGGLSASTVNTHTLFSLKNALRSPPFKLLSFAGEPGV